MLFARAHGNPVVREVQENAITHERVELTTSVRVVTAGGLQFVKDEWRQVPADLEAEILKNEYLETTEENPFAQAAVPEHATYTEEQLAEMKIQDLRKIGAFYEVKAASKEELIGKILLAQMAEEDVLAEEGDAEEDVPVDGGDDESTV